MTDIDPSTDQVRNHELAEQGDREHTESASEGDERTTTGTDERAHSEKPAEG